MNRVLALFLTLSACATPTGSTATDYAIAASKRHAWGTTLEWVGIQFFAGGLVTTAVALDADFDPTSPIDPGPMAIVAVSALAVGVTATLVGLTLVESGDALWREAP